MEDRLRLPGASTDAAVSTSEFDASHWHPVRHMPATVLQILEDDGVYKDLHFGMNLVTPGDLWKQKKRDERQRRTAV